MIVRTTEPGALRESDLTPESVFRNRRQFLRGAVVATLGAPLLGSNVFGSSISTQSDEPDPTRFESRPSADLYPAKRNETFTLDRDLTEEKVAATHNVFDEFSVKRDEIWRLVDDFRTTPWKIHIGGQVAKAITVDIDDLVRQFGVEERLYRHRCVEAWAMAVPWSGFPLARLVELAQPTAKARYLRMVSAHRPEQMPGWYAGRRVFPYYEALTIEEATHPLAFLATGIYGHPLPGQHGAPLRLAVPWKWGLKSLKSIVAFQFTEERPGTFWNDLSPGNYSWHSNVDPVGFTAWSQKSETMLGTGEVRETKPFNGYGEQVAHLYAG